MRNLFSEYLDDFFKKNGNSILITADLGFSVFDEFRKKYSDRFINIGVAEQNMIGVAAGIKSKGINVFAYSISNFGVMRCLEQLRNDVIYHQLNVKLCCVGGGFAYGNLGYTHLGVEDMGALSLFNENIDIFCPSTREELKIILPLYFKSKKFSYLRLYRNNEINLEYDQIKNFYSIKGKIQKNLIITVGPISEEIFKIRDRNFCHINFHTLTNIPKNVFISIFDSKKIKNIIFVEEHTVVGSFFNTYLIKCAEYKVKLKSLFNRHFSLKKYKKNGSNKYLRKYYKMSSIDIEAILKNL
ncbi:hypothetical protein N9440_04300 [Alphaproteobacteria bacterium]|nr:hypothetical protein [Alphaproteobacteria bacterium]